MKIRVLYHDHCFDGAASAAFFTRFLQDKFHPDGEFAFTGMAHKASQIFEDSLFDGDVNAIVDFKYAANPKLTWWFDHHQSAFLTPEDAEHYEATRNVQRVFDPNYRSCTRFIADYTREHFGYDPSDLADLVHWAEIIDGALYKDANEAVSLEAPAMKLMLVIEGSKGSETVQKIIRLLRHTKLDQIMIDPSIAELFGVLHQRHLDSIDIIREEATCEGGVIYFDISGRELASYNKFVPYYLFPESVYTVSLSISSFRTKISVGSNPWTAKELKHNLASICERYGGGGHPRVGAISFEKSEVEKARKVALEIVEELKA